MRDWMKLDKNNIPPDILMDGKYEFKFPYRKWAPTVPFLVSGVDAMIALGKASEVLYRKKAVEPFIMDGEILSCAHFVNMKDCEGLNPRTELTINFAGHPQQEAIRTGQRVNVVITPIDE